MVRPVMALVLTAMLLLFVSCQAGPAPGPVQADSLPSPVEQQPAPEPPPPKSSEPPEPAPPSPEERQREGELLAPQVEALCREYSVTGMSLVVFDRYGPFYRQNWGWAVKETGQPVTGETIFRVASISKAVTALLALDLADKGLLDLHGAWGSLLRILTARRRSSPPGTSSPTPPASSTARPTGAPWRGRRCHPWRRCSPAATPPARRGAATATATWGWAS